MQFLHLLCFSINTIFSSKVNLNCNVFTYSSCRSFINWTHCHQLALCVSNISFWFNTGKRQATIISSPSSELFGWILQQNSSADLATKKEFVLPLFFFLCVYLPMKSGMPFQWVTSLRDQQCISMQRSYWTFTSLRMCTKWFSNIPIWCTWVLTMRQNE